MYTYNTLRIKDIAIEHMHSPIGIDCAAPRFGWKLLAEERDVCQSAYRLELIAEGTDKGNGLCVSVDPEQALRADSGQAYDSETVCDSKKVCDNGKAYDSGRVETDKSIEVTADGFTPAPRMPYLVRLTVWDNRGRQASAETRFETGRMGELFRSGWVEPVQDPTPSTMELAHDTDAVSASVIAVDEKGERTYEEFRPAQYIRIPFRVEKPVRRARIYATAHGLYRLEVNGARPDEREFAPENTSYDKLLYYQTYDITDLLRPGENAAGVTLADGWWAGRVGTTGDCCQYGDTVGLLLDGEITYMDGTVAYFSGEDGISSEGPIRFSDLFVGEKYDAGREMPGWSEPGFDDAAWKPVERKAYSQDNLLGQIAPPVLPVRVFAPQRIFAAPNGDLILDAGQVLAGQIEVTLTAARAGQEIRFTHFEVLDKDGNYFDSILNVNKDQTDIYITKEGNQTWRPAFTYHGFRYVRISGWEEAPGGISLLNFRIFAFRSQMEDIGHFETSDPRLNQLQRNIWWSQTSNTISIPTDCPQREKAGWTGDIMAYAPTLCFLTESDAFLHSWLANVRADQLADGAVPMIVPYLKAYATFLKDNLGTDTSCGWGDAVILVPYAMYRAYGDVRALEENYDAMTRWMDYIRFRAENFHPEGYETWDEARQERDRYLWSTDFHFGDWLIPSIVLGNPDGAAMNQTAYATMGIVAPAYYALSARTMAQIAKILGRAEDAAGYQALYEKIREAFITEYVHADGTMDADFQGIYVIALQIGLVTEQVRPRMAAHLREMIEANGDRLDTGFLSVLFLMDVLCDNGCEDVAYRLLTQTKCPSWLYEVMTGATTIWESWGAIDPDGTVSTYSYNHYAFGCVGDWMYRHIGGLQMTEPGYKGIRVRPAFMPGLDWVKVSEETPYGHAAVEWRRAGEQVCVHIEIPVNTRAVIELPGQAPRQVGSGRYDLVC